MVCSSAMSSRPVIGIVPDIRHLSDAPKPDPLDG